MPARYSKPVTVEELDHRARAILLRNDRGTYTVPNGRVYPFQWNWDSAFASLGFAALATSHCAAPRIPGSRLGNTNPTSLAPPQNG